MEHRTAGPARSSILYLLFSMLGLTVGCCPHAPPVLPAAYYDGPTQPMEAVIARINENNSKIPTLWTELTYSATINDPVKKTSDSFDGGGGLMYAQPRNLLLNGDKAIIGHVFQLGSNDTDFWVQMRASADTFNYWWGHYANLGKPGCLPVPIRPDLVLQVLGAGVYGPDFLQPPVPVMRFDNDHDAYVFDLNVPQGYRWETSEEIWYDRKSMLPRRVLLFGDKGRLLLKAELSNHRAVESPGLARNLWPQIAGHYELFFPESRSTITFDFSDTPQLRHELRKNHFIPDQNTFERVDPGEDNKVIQVDKDCANAAMAR